MLLFWYFQEAKQMRKRSVFRIALPSFDRHNTNIIEHSFLCNLPLKGDSLTNLRSFTHMELQGKAYVLPQQSQSSVCIFADSPSTDFLKCNALVTNRPNLFLMIKTIDSIPLLLSDHINRVIGIVNVDLSSPDELIRNTLLKMLESGAEIRHINAVLGPYIHDNIKDRFFSNGTNQESVQYHPPKYTTNLHDHFIELLEKMGIKSVHGVSMYTHLIRKESTLHKSGTSGEDDRTCNISMISISTTENSHVSPQHENTTDWDSFIRSVTKVSDKFAHPCCHKPTKPAIGLTPNTKDKVVTYNKPSNLNTSGLDFAKNADPDFLRKIKRRKINIDKTLDLHGETVESAYRKTIQFILENYVSGLRYLLIIVGKGRTGDAVIKTSLVSWLENNAEIRGLIKFVAEALPHHGGEGAYYVFLRRKRPFDE
ncbi:DNA mismatch repair protein MutS [Neorickettsia findlayensis]|uniref:DNA mismatch repair protein MutS n=2 Tax=Neorickettsia findlayensis TaxID=2686014 RepID=A0A6P1G9Q7_9RICK|nr:DNA mismatch repair protein MutS [Neorickettsia findlayensis]